MDLIDLKTVVFYRTFNSSSSSDSSAMDHVETYDLNSNVWTANTGYWYRNDGKYNRDEVSQLESEINKNISAISAKTKLYPTIEKGKWVGLNGVINDADFASIYKFGVTPSQAYWLNAYAPASLSWNIVNWYDASGNFLSCDLKATSGAEDVIEGVLLTPPTNATEMWINVHNGTAKRNSLYRNDGRIEVSREVMRQQGALPSCDLNEVIECGFWILTDSSEYSNMPITGTSLGFLRVSLANDNWGIQEFISFAGGDLYKRRFDVLENSFETWQKITATHATNYNNNYTFQHYQQTLNLEATPTITADSNNYLASTGDSSNRTADILALLQSTGICHLGPGKFYVDSLVMPNNTSLIGSGAATEVILLSGDNKFAIKMSEYNSIRDFTLSGASWITPSESVGTRHGILWQGNFTASQNNGETALLPYMGLVSNLFIKSFAGGGITCYDTGTGVWNCIEVENCHIWNCDVGINISYYSEFHKFTNVKAIGCQFGCINNGGNNVFVNCDFSANRSVAFLMDNSQGQSPNNSHGSAVGCVFNHTAGNVGIGIKILNNPNGFIFDGCQIFYSQIYIQDSYGMAFTNCNFGLNNCEITIEGDGCTLLANNIFPATPTITKNAKTRIVSCYTKNGEIVA